MKKWLFYIGRLVVPSVAGFAFSALVFAQNTTDSNSKLDGLQQGASQQEISQLDVSQAAPPKNAQQANSIDAPIRLEVIDSFVELRTGPGRGYPIFYVIEQGEFVEVQVRRAGWYEVRTQAGRTGWATPSQLSRTLQSTGEPADLPTVSFGDYLKNKWRVGFTAGEFFNGELKGTDIFTGTISYRFLSWFSTEFELGKVLNSETEGDIYSGNLLFEPFSQRRLSPELLLGAGQLSLDSQPELADLDSGDSDFFNYGLGVNFYLGRNFVVRGEYRQYRVSTDDNKVTLDSWKIGFNTFF